MSEFNATYEKAVTTGRSGEQLARRHGFDSLSSVAESLPEDAHVLDLGAGTSMFGEEVVRLRPDVTWTNFDYSYNNPEILDEVLSSGSSKVNYEAGDATKLLESHDAESHDAVFSYWMWPHLSIDNPQPAIEAAKNVFGVLKPGAVAYIGPQVAAGRLHPFQRRQSLRLEKDGVIDEEVFTQNILEATMHSDAARRRRQFRYDVAMDFFGTTRWRKDAGKSIYSPTSEGYVRLMSLEGMRTLGSLGLAAVKHTVSKKSA